MSGFELDIRSTLFLLAIGNLAAFATLLAYTRRAVHEPSTRLYMGGALLQVFAWALLFLRGDVPDFLSVYIGNALLLSSFGLECLALCLVDAHSRRLYTVFGGLALLGIAGFCLFAGSANGRVAAASFATVLPYAALAAAMLGRRGRGLLRVFIGAVAALYCVVHLLRAVSAIRGGPAFSLMTPALIQSLAFLPLFVLLIVGTAGFILMLKEKGDGLLRESEEKYRSLVERASEAIIIAQDERFAFVNKRMAELLGLPAAELEGRPFADFVWPEDRQAVVDRHLARLRREEPPDTYDFRMIGASGGILWMSLSTALIAWKGRPATLSLLTDITARKASEERIARLLAEKEALLKEVHHRIKNNLAVAMGLLSMQAGSAEGKDPASVLLDARNRLQSLVLLYDRLHDSGGSESMPVAGFLGPLVREIMAVFSSSPSVRVELELGDFSLEVGRLITLGMMVNEIVTNSMKHAFGGTADPAIRISASLSGGRIRVSCGDNGRGLPAKGEGASGGAAAPSGMGLQLIELLAGQLKADMSVVREGGSAYVLEFDAAAPA